MKNTSETWSEGRVYTIRDLLHLLLEYFRELKRKWYVYLIFLVLLGAFFIYKSVSTIPDYTATVTYMVQGEEGNPFGGAASILSQFGLGMGRVNYNLNKVVALASTDKIIRNAILTKDTVNGKNDYLANHIIEIYEFDERWEKKEKEDLIGFRFTSDSISGENFLENKVMNDVIGYVRGNEDKQGMISSGFDDLSGILNLAIKTQSQELSCSMALRLFASLKTFYNKGTLEGQRKTLDVVENKRDSIYAELIGVERALARFQDQSKGFFLYESRLNQFQLERERQKLSTMYGEAVKNVEIAQFTIRSNTPLLEAIDTPWLPLKPKAFGLKKAVILTLVLTILIGTVLIFFWKIIRDALHPV